MFWEKNGDCFFEAKIKPDSTGVSLKIRKGIVLLSVTKPPVKNQANREIISLLSEFFGCEVDIEKSLPDYRKVIRVKGINVEQLKKKLGASDE